MKVCFLDSWMGMRMEQEHGGYCVVERIPFGKEGRMDPKSSTWRGGRGAGSLRRKSQETVALHKTGKSTAGCKLDQFS